MFSIIICSVCPQRLEALKTNIGQSIGVDYEVIAIDNSQKKWPIAKVYNYGAGKAKFPFLFFVHEDVRFHSNGWGEYIIRKMQEPDCGVIGFAGSKIRIDCFAGWCQGDEYTVSYLFQGLHNGLTEFRVANAYLERPFEEVITLDGLGLFVRREVWEKYPFDEELLTSFHCYDIDFTLQIAYAHLKNYVCCSNKVLIEHFSLGNFDERWFSNTMRCHQKWKRKLPMKTDDVTLSDKQRYKYEEGYSYDFLKRIFKLKALRKDKWFALKEFWKRPLTRRHLRRCVSYTVKYIFKK
jgi:hypothetical protein